MKTRLLDFIQHHHGDFNTLAIDLYKHHLAHNLAYSRYCNNLGVGADSVQHWRDIPTVPTDVFRHVHLFCGQPHEAAFVFRTSGTTSGLRGEHLLKNLDVYHASALTSIQQLLLPPGALPDPDTHALMLAPPPDLLPDSSLSSMLGLIGDTFFPTTSTFAWTRDTLDLDLARHWIDDRRRDRRPGLILATSFALVSLLDHLKALDADAHLPPGSIVMPTGGTKGRTREISAAELEARLVDSLGVSPERIVQEYGMTELCSQLYDPRLARALTGLPPLDRPALTAPPWCRVTVHDPLTLEPLEPGQIGLLRFTDLSNLDSVCSVQTSDRGLLLDPSEAGDTIELLGRAPGATPRGCSLLIEEAGL